MIRTIMVPLDGSKFGEHALPLAITTAQKNNARVVLAHVHPPPPTPPTELAIVAAQDLDPVDRRSEAVYLEKMKTAVSAFGVEVTTALLEGPVAEVLHDYAVRTSADLAVVATHGRGPLSRFWLGSTADSLIRMLPMPILVVRPTGTAPAEIAPAPALERWLMPVDSTSREVRSIDAAIEVAHDSGTHFTLMTVVEPIPYVGFGMPAPVNNPEVMERMQQEAAGHIRDLGHRLRNKGLRVEERICVEGGAAAGILDEAASGRYDAIALPTHGRGGIERFLLGSVADKVLRASTLPVLVTHLGSS